MNTFTNTLINKPYTYENINLLELRRRLIDQEHLTRIDILKGYFTKKELRINPEIASPLSADDIAIIEDKVNELSEITKDEMIQDYLQYEKEQIQKFQTALDKECLNRGISSISANDYIANPEHIHLGYHVDDAFFL